MVIVEPLPEETYLVPGEGLNMSITISAAISSKEEITLSLKHSSRDSHKDLTKYLEYQVLEETGDIEYNQDKTRKWKINMTLPYPHSQASGDLILTVKDDHSGDVTSTLLVMSQEANGGGPFFDPVPSSVQGYTGEDVLIAIGAKGLTPLIVSIIFFLIFQ